MIFTSKKGMHENQVEGVDFFVTGMLPKMAYKVTKNCLVIWGIGLVGSQTYFLIGQQEIETAIMDSSING
jgi:hypothetical protein